MVIGYVPPNRNKRKLVYESHVHLWDDPYLFRVCSDRLLRRWYQLKKESKQSRDVIHHPMEDTMEHFVHIQRSSKVDFSSQPCMKTQKNPSRDVKHVRDMAISILEMPCH